MCGFGVQFFMCGHFELLNDGIHTRLCNRALGVNMVQHRDRAPAVCWPLPEEFERYTGEHVAYYLFTQGACSNPSCQLLKPEAGQPADLSGMYESKHWGLVDDVFGIICKYGNTAKEMIQFILANPNMVREIQHPALRRFFNEDISWDRKLRYFLPRLVEADQLAGRLMVFLNYDAPRCFFFHTLNHTVSMLEGVRAKIEMLQELLWLLQVPELDHVSIADIGSRFEYFPPPESSSRISSILSSYTVSDLDTEDYRSPILPPVDDPLTLYSNIDQASAHDAAPSSQTPEPPEECLMGRWLGEQLQAAIDGWVNMGLKPGAVDERPALSVGTGPASNFSPSTSAATTIDFLGLDDMPSASSGPDFLTQREKVGLLAFTFEALPLETPSYARDLPSISPTDVSRNSAFNGTSFEQDESEALRRDDSSEEIKSRMLYVSRHRRGSPACIAGDCIRANSPNEQFRPVMPHEIKQESLSPGPFAKDYEVRQASDQTMQDVTLSESDSLITRHGAYKRPAC